MVKDNGIGNVTVQIARTDYEKLRRLTRILSETMGGIHVPLKYAAMVAIDEAVERRNDAPK